VKVDCLSWGACVLLTSGQVRCWGGNGEGELGRGTFGSSFQFSEAIANLNASDIALGNYHACAIRRNMPGMVCWGRNLQGQLGDNTAIRRSSPTEVPVLNNTIIANVRPGYYSTCAVRAVDNVGLCWGLNDFGMLGIGSSGGIVLTPQQINPSLKWLAVVPSRGYSYFTCGIELATRLVKCWGQGGNQLGVNTSGTPVNAPRVDYVVDIANF
jgi:alpha-tubulin suppressor-like RCC1 family protein